ncbi:MAG: DUF4303 domain-containing protein [Huintestinicola sp.]|uniref:DUF4303 domain-containing protein n=1 Tax=Huintestinicola sp. TaxID=2981661 RepID=UPI003F00A2C9
MHDENRSEVLENFIRELHLRLQQMENEKLIEALENAFKNAVTSLREEHKENFYYFAFIFDEGLHPYISAWSYEAYEKSVIENKITEEDKSWWKWDYADSPYAVYGYDEFFSEASSLLDERAGKLSDDELYDREWFTRMWAMEEALKRLDISGFFGIGESRKNVVINVEQAPPDCQEYERALRLNPQSELLCEYLEVCERDEQT